MKKKRWNLGWVLLAALCLSMSLAMTDCEKDDDDNDRAGIFSVRMSGGNGDDGLGGDGGGIELYTYGIKGINILRGARNLATGFKLPEEPDIDLGLEPVVIDDDTTVNVYPNQAAAQAAVADGGLYTWLGANQLWIRDSVGGDVIATGLHVRRGRVLTLGLNANVGGNSGQDTGRYYFDNDVVIDGVVTTKDLTTGDVGGGVVEAPHGAATVRDKGGLDIRGFTFIVGNTGRIDLSGGNATTAGDRGGDGGGLFLYASNAAYIHGRLLTTGGMGNGAGIGGDGAVGYNGGMDQVYTGSEDGVLVLTGLVDASGGKGSEGGDGGFIEPYADTFILNTGVIKTNGGDGTNGDGGDGGGMYLRSYYAGILSRGDLISNGGDALGTSTAYSGGNGGNIDLDAGYGEYMSQLLIGGPVSADGGDSKLGDGGDGGDMYWNNYGSGDIVVAARVSANGGDGKGAGSFGGDAGDLWVFAYSEYDYGYGEYAKSGDIIFGANLDFSGGNADNGGDGGEIYLEASDYEDEAVPTNGIFFYGYDLIRAEGGNGADGGDGGYFEAYTEDSYSLDQYYMAGPIVTNFLFVGHGGKGNDGWGGDGGYFDQEAEGEAYEDKTVSIHRGNVLIGGGDGSDGGGDGGYFYLYGHELAKQVGDVDVSGGSGAGVDASGGLGGDALFFATYDVIINGNVNANGGGATGTGTGGDGGAWWHDQGIQIYAGGQAVVRGSLTAKGGNGDRTVGFGGNGGGIDLFSEGLPSLVGNWSVAGGKAGTDGNHGEMWIDWALLTP